MAPTVVVLQGAVPQGWREWRCWLIGHKVRRTATLAWECRRCHVEAVVTL